MEYRKWYEEEINTSLLGFGAMRLATIDGEIDKELGFKLFDEAYKNGVNYFDTAYPYTNKKNETFVGEALKRYPRDSFYLATKLSLFCFNTKEEAYASLENQLKTLQTDYVDFYLMHALDKKKFELIKEWKIMDKMLEYKKQGKIRHIGFSFHDSYEVFKEILDYFDWEFCQIQLNYMDQDIQQGLKGYYDLRERKIPVVIMEPVKGGKLANFNEKVAQYFKDYDETKSLASWALRWVGSLDGVKVILSGMNSMDQVKDNLETFNNFKPLNKEEMGLVEKVRTELKKVTKVGCTACKYCLPCPQGVNIPALFSIYNDYTMYKNKDNSEWIYSGLKNSNSTGLNCIGCGLCETKCPQGIKIPEVISEFYKDLSFLK